MGTPQIVVICCYVIGFMRTAEKHGQPKEGKYNVFIDLIGTAISILILWWGGFWS